MTGPADPDAALTDGVVRLVPGGLADGARVFSVAAPGAPDGPGLGSVSLTERPDGRGLLAWEWGSTVASELRLRALTLLVEHALGPLGLGRVEALLDPDDEHAVRDATRVGFRREGLLRGWHAGSDAGADVTGANEAGDAARDDRADRLLLARLATDPPTGDARGFRSMLNAFLPRKRAIGQMLVRDEAGRVLLCGLTYKDDWDLPGGVVEVNESPRTAVSRELQEELGLRIPAGRLLLTDWLPPWSGWDDAICLVFDGGVRDASLVDDAILEAREIRSVAFCTPDQVRERAADFTARRIESALASLEGPGGPAYTESGRP